MLLQVTVDLSWLDLSRLGFISFVFTGPFSSPVDHTAFDLIPKPIFVSTAHFTPFLDTAAHIGGTPFIVCSRKEGGGEHFILGIVDTFVGNAKKKEKKWNPQNVSKIVSTNVT